VQMPQPRSLLKAAPVPCKTILLVDGDELLGPLARQAGEFSLVSPADIRRAPSPRGDVAAALLGRRAGALPDDILDKLPNLNLVGFAGLSLAHLEPEAILARGISLMHASEAYAESVAEFALGLAILGRRRAFLSHEILRAGGWGSDPGMLGLIGTLRRAARKARPSLKVAGLEKLALGAWRKTKPLVAGASGFAGVSRDLKGATAGLIGWGANARAFARRLTDVGVRGGGYRFPASRPHAGDAPFPGRVGIGAAQARRGADQRGARRADRTRRAARSPQPGRYLRLPGHVRR